MKYYHSIMMAIATMAALTFTACGDDDSELPAPEPEATAIDITINPDDAGHNSKGVAFTATGDWTLTSDQMWCQLQQGDKTAMSLTGGAGEQEVYIVVDPSAATGEEQKAVITLTTGGKSRTLANVTLGTIAYRGTITINDHPVHSGQNSGLYVFESDVVVSISANFDFHLEMPEWCLVNGSGSFEGKADEEYEARFTFNDASSSDKRYKQTGELVFASETIRDTFTITYNGMDKYALEIGFGETGLSPWNWSVDPAQQTYTHPDGSDGTKVFNGGIPFTVTCRDDKVNFLYATRKDGKQVFTTEVDYATVTGSGNSYTFSIKNVDNLASGGMLLAFAAAAWDTISADPYAALTEWDEQEGRTALSTRALNSVAISWTKVVPKNSPFTLHHLNKTIETDDYYGFIAYETTSTSAYANIFGANAEVWQCVIAPDEVDICLELEGYENTEDYSMYFGIKAGFDDKLDLDLETLRMEPWECSWPFTQPKKAAIQLNLAADHRATLANSPLFIKMPVGDKTYGLVLKAK